MTQDAPEPTAPVVTGREVGAALGLLYGGTLLVLVLSFAVPGLRSWQQPILAVFLVMIPSFVLRRHASPLSIDDLGVGLGPWRLTLVTSALTMAVVFSLFALGFHLWVTAVSNATPVFESSQLLQWRSSGGLLELIAGDELERAPQDVCRESGRRDRVRVWFAPHSSPKGQRGMYVVGPADKRLSVAIRALPGGVGAAWRLKCTAGGGLVRAGRVGPSLGGSFEVPRGIGVFAPLKHQLALAAEFRLDGQPLAAGRLVGGPYERPQEEQPLEAQLSLWWMLTYLIVHLGLVALPEEWFFRGYLQPRLDQRFGTPLRLFGAHIGWGAVLSALAFALLHPILVPGVHRLAVFFPALLFGWLRAKTGNIGAAVVVHACANLLQVSLSRFYV